MARDKTDSETHTEERRAKIKAESDRLSAEAEAVDEERRTRDAKRDAKVNEDDADALEKQAGLVKDNETRDQLLERVRQMREVQPNGPPPPLGPSSFAKEQISIEQQAGKDAISKAAKEQEKINEMRKKAEEERLAREGGMSTVHTPNPGQNEQFPADKATLGKTK